MRQAVAVASDDGVGLEREAVVAIDITFDFRTDASGDPDASSPTLLRDHQLLWSKPLPSGRDFQLTPRSQKPYVLLHDSDLGRFFLTSDSVLATFTRRPDMQTIIGQLPPADIDALNTITYTIGGMILWPGNQIDGQWTINQARGCSGRIADRFDLTVECNAATTRATRRTRSLIHSAATATSSTSSAPSLGTSTSGSSMTS